MELKIQKRLAAQIMKCSPKKIVFDILKLKEIKEAITKADIKILIANNIIWRKPIKNSSRGGARRIAEQKRKGRRRGAGKRKGKTTARLSRKDSWKLAVRSQRKLLKSLRNNELITKKDYHLLYRKSKGGFFRSRRHIKMYLEEHGLFQKKVI